MQRRPVGSGGKDHLPACVPACAGRPRTKLLSDRPGVAKRRRPVRSMQREKTFYACPVGAVPGDPPPRGVDAQRHFRRRGAGALRVRTSATAGLMAGSAGLAVHGRALVVRGGSRLLATTTTASRYGVRAERGEPGHGRASGPGDRVSLRPCRVPRGSPAAACGPSATSRPGCVPAPGPFSPSPGDRPGRSRARPSRAPPPRWPVCVALNVGRWGQSGVPGAPGRPECGEEGRLLGGWTLPLAALALRRCLVPQAPLHLWTRPACSAGFQGLGRQLPARGCARGCPKPAARTPLVALHPVPLLLSLM